MTIDNLIKDPKYQEERSKIEVSKNVDGEYCCELSKLFSEQLDNHQFALESLEYTEKELRELIEYEKAVLQKIIPPPKNKKLKERFKEMKKLKRKTLVDLNDNFQSMQNLNPFTSTSFVSTNGDDLSFLEAHTNVLKKNLEELKSPEKNNFNLNLGMGSVFSESHGTNPLSISKNIKLNDIFSTLEKSPNREGSPNRFLDSSSLEKSPNRSRERSPNRQNGEKSLISRPKLEKSPRFFREKKSKPQFK